MIDQIKTQFVCSIRRCCRVLGFRRQTYHKRKQGHRPEEEDDRIAKLLHETTQRFIAWGFWMVFYFLRLQGHTWNHKRVYRIWKQEQLNLRVPAQRPKIRRAYQDLLASYQVNEGWAMDFVSDWTIGPEKKLPVLSILWMNALVKLYGQKLIVVLRQKH
jgi:putative transposase